jgi:predicted dehydrogenase
MVKAAIIGCGRIADSHASQMQRIPGCEIVGVCDREELMAKQLFERFRVKGYYSDMDQLLKEARPDVVHITTPPQSHCDIAKRCLEFGCHVYVEKPFSLNTAEAEDIIALAEKKGLKITAGHDDQFRHSARRMRELVGQGYLGGQPVHMESYYCYELGETGYAKALVADKQHWVRKLPGGLLQNIISHGIARIAEFLTTDSPRVIADGYVSPVLRKMGERQLVDELRVIISEADRTTAYFTFSSQMRPALHQFRIYGPKNGLVIDQDHETLIKLRGSRHKSYMEQFIPPANFARQYLGNLSGNVRKFLKADFHAKAGMKFLIESFYESIKDGKKLPISYREILLTSKIMDSIFQQLREQNEERQRSENGSFLDVKNGAADKLPASTF